MEIPTALDRYSQVFLPHDDQGRRFYDRPGLGRGDSFPDIVPIGEFGKIGAGDFSRHLHRFGYEAIDSRFGRPMESKSSQDSSQETVLPISKALFGTARDLAFPSRQAEHRPAGFPALDSDSRPWIT